VIKRHNYCCEWLMVTGNCSGRRHGHQLHLCPPQQVSFFSVAFAAIHHCLIMNSLVYREKEKMNGRDGHSEQYLNFLLLTQPTLVEQSESAHFGCWTKIQLLLSKAALCVCYQNIWVCLVTTEFSPLHAFCWYERRYDGYEKKEMDHDSLYCFLLLFCWIYGIQSHW